jgi:hypothetical protein
MEHSMLESFFVAGNLPTFVDVSSNFASYEITEDNIIDQARGCYDFLKSIFAEFFGEKNWRSRLETKLNYAKF